MGEASPLLIGMGLGMMLVWALVALLKPQAALTCALFASAPAFQLFWLGLGLDGPKIVRIGPAVAVPAIVIPLIAFISARRRRAGMTARTDSER